MKLFKFNKDTLAEERNVFLEIMNELGKLEKENGILFGALREACEIAKQARPEAQYRDPKYYINLAENKYYGKRHEIFK